MSQVIILLTLITISSALYPNNGNVIDLTSTNFHQLVLETEEIWIVEFFVPWCGYCQNFVPEYIKAAAALKGTVKVGAVNADKFKDLTSKYRVQGFPTILIFGENKNQPKLYDGARLAMNIAEVALEVVKNKINNLIMGKEPPSKLTNDNLYSNTKNMMELTDLNFDQLVLASDDFWLVNFYAPWCGHCKKFAPLWVKSAIELQDKIKLGAFDATRYLIIANKYNIHKYPTIMLFSPKTGNSPIEFDSEYSVDGLVQWSLNERAKLLPGPQVIELVDQSTFNIICKEKPLCVLSVLPHILDCQSDCRKSYLKLLENLGEEFKQNMWGWGWSEGGSQPHLENAVGIGGYGYPALAVVNVKKLKYSVFKGAFSKKAIYAFLRDLLYGKGNTNFLKNEELLDIVTIDKWDGKDRILQDLDDVNLIQKDEL